MTRSRREVSNRRTITVMSLLGGLLLYGLPRLASFDMGKVAPNSIFFGSMRSWPWWMKSFWPLDIAFTCGLFWWMMYLLMVKANQTYEEPVAPITYVWMVLGALSGFASLGGVIGASEFGWYRGIEFGIAFAGLCGALVGAVAVIWGIAWLFYLAGTKVNRFLSAEDIPDESEVK